MNLVNGVDVSIYQPRVNWDALRSQGFKFALIRATSGMGYVDPMFASHWANARTAGLLRAPYHYLIAEQDARKQADLFIAIVGPDKGELPPIVDLEDAYNENVPTATIISTCKKFLDFIEQAFGRRPMVYSRKTYLDAHFTQGGVAPAWAKDYDIWLAQYPWSFNEATMPNVNMPQQPSGWKEWKIWQYSESAFIKGVTDENGTPTRIDLDWFRGTEAELFQFAKVQAPVALTYFVKAGDTFEDIAAKFNVSVTELIKANPSLLPVGFHLTIPGRVQVPTVPSTDTTPKPPAVPSGGGTGGATAPSKPVITHNVKSGDTLFAIALKYHTTIDKIMELNPQITNKNIIAIGQVIVIPS